MNALAGKTGSVLLYILSGLLIVLVSLAVYSTVTVRSNQREVQTVVKLVRAQCSAEKPDPQGCRALIGRILKYADDATLARLHGERGKTGIPGKTGPRGPRGVAGPPGPLGPAGPRGIRGIRGARGAAGKNGKNEAHGSPSHHKGGK